MSPASWISLEGAGASVKRKGSTKIISSLRIEQAVTICHEAQNVPAVSIKLSITQLSIFQLSVLSSAISPADSRYSRLHATADSRDLESFFSILRTFHRRYFVSGDRRRKMTSSVVDFSICLRSFVRYFFVIFISGGLSLRYIVLVGFPSSDFFVIAGCGRVGCCSCCSF